MAKENELTPTGSLAYSSPRGMGASSSYGASVGVHPGVGPEGWLGCFAHPSGGGVCRDSGVEWAVPWFCSRLLKRGSWVFLTFGSSICPKCTCTQLFSALCSFAVFRCLRRSVSRCEHWSKVSQVPVCLRLCVDFMVCQKATQLSTFLWGWGKR